nr:MAG TPA: hypothetical protein [Caudoviricetes sp.]
MRSRLGLYYGTSLVCRPARIVTYTQVTIMPRA